MKFKASKSKILQVIWIVSKAISAWATLPILGNILMEANDWSLVFTATDLDLTITHKIDAEVEEQWSITVPARLFQSYLNLLSDTDISFSSTDNKISISTTSSKTELKWINASDFPKILKENTWGWISISWSKLKKAVNEVVFSVSDSNARPVLTWVQFKVKWNEATMTSTDSYRMSHNKFKLEVNWSQEEKTLIVPSNTLNEVSKILSEFQAISNESFDVAVNISDNQILFEIWATKVYSRLIEWNFPNCETLIPATHSSRIVINKADLLQSIKRLSIFAKEDNNKLTMDFEDWILKLSTTSTQIWSDESEIQCAMDWDKISVVLNALFVIDFLSSINHKEVVLESCWELSPVVLKNPDSSDYVHIIMPVRA